MVGARERRLDLPTGQQPRLTVAYLGPKWPPKCPPGPPIVGAMVGVYNHHCTSLFSTTDKFPPLISPLVIRKPWCSIGAPLPNTDVLRTTGDRIPCPGVDRPDTTPGMRPELGMSGEVQGGCNVARLGCWLPPRSPPVARAQAGAPGRDPHNQPDNPPDAGEPPSLASRADPHTPLLVWLHGDHPTRSHKSPSETGQRVRPPPPPRQNPSFGGSFLTPRVTPYVVAPPTLPAETTLPNQQALPPPPKSPAREPPSSPRDGHQHYQRRLSPAKPAARHREPVALTGRIC